MFTKQEIENKVNSVPRWWHTITFPHGVITNGKMPLTHQNWISNFVPKDLTGKSVLDIGSWDGFFSFLAERRGASRIVAVDDLEHWVEDVILGNEGFLVAKEIFNSIVEFKDLDVNYLVPSDFYPNSKFDVVFCFGLLYHLKAPYLVLENLAKICTDTLYVEAHVKENDHPMLYFYGPDELNKDPTNYWGISVPCISKMCRRAGFSSIKILGRYPSSRYFFEVKK